MHFMIDTLVYRIEFCNKAFAPQEVPEKGPIGRNS